MSGKPEPVVTDGSLAAERVPAVRLRTKTSLAPPLSPGARLVVPAGASKATAPPSALMAERSVVPLACTPAVVWAARTVVPAAMSRTTISEEAPFASTPARLVARPDPKETRLPSPDTSGSPNTAALALLPAELTETRLTAPVVMSLRKTSWAASASADVRLLAVEANTT